MRPHAAKAIQDDPEAGSSLPRRSSLAANAIAMACAAAVLAIAVWLRAAELLRSPNRLYMIVAVTVVFALAARLTHGVSNSGALAGAAVALVLMIARLDFNLFGVLLVVFFLTLAATRAGHRRKQQLKVAEAERGRSASQVMANLGVAALLLAFPSIKGAHLLALAALAEAAADTASSEIGTAFSTRTILITSWQTVSPGTDGGISVTGTAAGIFAALIIAACAAAFGLLPPAGILIVGAAGVAGMLMDSLIGATLEKHGYLNNDAVNLLGTAAAAGFAWLLK